MRIRRASRSNTASPWPAAPRCSGDRPGPPERAEEAVVAGRGERVAEEESLRGDEQSRESSRDPRPARPRAQARATGARARSPGAACRGGRPARVQAVPCRRPKPPIEPTHRLGGVKARRRSPTRPRGARRPARAEALTRRRAAGPRSAEAPAARGRRARAARDDVGLLARRRPQALLRPLARPRGAGDVDLLRPLRALGRGSSRGSGPTSAKPPLTARWCSSRPVRYITSPVPTRLRRRVPGRTPNEPSLPGTTTSSASPTRRAVSGSPPRA
jgi:hypothetical protein